MLAVTNGKSPSFFQEVHELLDILGQKIGLFCHQFEKANDARKAVMRGEGLKVQARLAVLKAGLDIPLGENESNEA